jgi:hypothetical protein
VFLECYLSSFFFSQPFFFLSHTLLTFVPHGRVRKPSPRTIFHIDNLNCDNNDTDAADTIIQTYSQRKDKPIPLTVRTLNLPILFSQCFTHFGMRRESPISPRCEHATFRNIQIYLLSLSLSISSYSSFSTPIAATAAAANLSARAIFIGIFPS